MSENKNISTKSTQTNIIILVIRFRLQLTEQGQSLVKNDFCTETKVRLTNLFAQKREISTLPNIWE